MRNKKLLTFLIIMVIVVAAGSIYYFGLIRTNPHSSKNSNPESSSKEEEIKTNVPVIINVGNSKDAKIYIDGKLIGEGKAETTIKEGVHLLRVVDEKKGEYSEPFFLSKDVGTFKKTVNVLSKGRVINFITGIENSTIFVDGIKVITFNKSIEIMIPIGKHTIEITSPGYESFKKDLNITEDFGTSLNISLKKKN
jgi:hypothetical protein